MYKYRVSVLQGSLLIAFITSTFLFAPPAPAQDEGMTFEQAQTRTSYARRQMETMRREVKKAEAAEEAALRDAEELKKRHETAVKKAEKATQARQDAEEKFAAAREKWSAEAARLKRIHDDRESQR